MFSELFAFTLFVLPFVVAVDVHVGIKILLKLFTALFFVFPWSVLLFGAVVVLLDGIKMLLILFTILLFIFAFFVLPIVVWVNLQAHKEIEVERGFQVLMYHFKAPVY